MIDSATRWSIVAGIFLTISINSDTGNSSEIQYVFPSNTMFFIYLDRDNKTRSLEFFSIFFSIALLVTDLLSYFSNLNIHEFIGEYEGFKTKSGWTMNDREGVICNV